MIRQYTICYISFLLIAFGGAWMLHHSSLPLSSLHFALTDHHLRRVTEHDFAGGPLLIFFGFTQCSSICPVTLARLNDVLDALPRDGWKAQGLFITLDPAHDTPQKLARYLESFRPGITGLTGTPEELAPLYSAFGVYPGLTHDADHPSDHSGLIYLVDGNGRLRARFTARMETPDIVRLITSFLESPAKESPHE